MRRSRLLVLLFAVSFPLLLIQGCSNPENEVPVLHTEQDYQETVDQVQKLTQGPFTKSEDISLTAKEEHNLRLAALKTEGLIGFHPELYTNYFIAGKIAFLLGDYRTALVDFNECVSQRWPEGTDKNYYIQTIAESKYMLSRCLFNQQEYQKAAQEATKAVQLEPKSVLYKMAEARAEFQMGHDKTAKGIVLDVLKLEPSNTEAHKMLDLIRRGSKQR